jgi:hypothetical protein
MTFRVLILVITALLSGATAPADTFVYVSVAAEKRIAVYCLDHKTGKLTHRSDSPVEDGEPGALTVDPPTSWRRRAMMFTTGSGRGRTSRSESSSAPSAARRS